MSDESKNLDIVIRTKAELAGVKDTSQALGELNRDTNELTAKSKKYAEQLLRQQNQEKENYSLKKLAPTVLKELGGDNPLVDAAATAIENPLLGGVKFLRIEIDSALESIKGLAERGTPEFATLAEGVCAQEEAFKKAEAESKAYESTLKRISTAKESVQDNARAGLDQMKDEHAAEIALQDKQHERDTAKIESDEKRGVISHEQAVAGKTALDDEYAQKRLDTQKKFANTELGEKYREYQNTYGEANELGKKVATETDDAKQKEGAAKFSEQRLSKDEADLKATDAKIFELLNEGDELKKKSTGWGAFTTLEPQYVLGLKKEQNEKELLAQQQLGDSLRKKIGQDQKSVSDTSDAAQKSKEDLAADRQRLRQDTERIAQLKRDLPRDEQKRKVEESHREEFAKIDAETRHLKATGDTAQKTPAGTGGGDALANHVATLEKAAPLIAKADAFNQNFLDAISQFNATADKMATSSAKCVAKLEEVFKILQDHEKRIDRLNSTRKGDLN